MLFIHLYRSKFPSGIDFFLPEKVPLIFLLAHVYYHWKSLCFCLPEKAYISFLFLIFSEKISGKNIYQNWAIRSSLNKWKEEWDSLFKTNPDSFFRARIWVTFFIPRDLCILSEQINSVNKEQVGGRALKYGCWVENKDWLPSKQKTLHVWVCVVWLYTHMQKMWKDINPVVGTCYITVGKGALMWICRWRQERMKAKKKKCPKNT